MRKIRAILKKQQKETLKNKEVLIQFIMFPILGIIMQNLVVIPDMPKNYFVLLFATMYIGMAPLTSMAAIISEEKEKNTLRILTMSNIKPSEYLIGIGTYVFFACMIGGVVFAMVGRYSGRQFFLFLSIMAIGILTSLLIGAAIGTWCKSQMAATSITVPVMAFFSFLPMIAMFNESIEKVSKFTYSQQISYLMNSIGQFSNIGESLLIIAINIVLVLCLFIFGYRNCGFA